MPSDTRLTAFGTVSTALALLSDRALRQALSAATPIGSGIGGKSAVLEVAGTPVFVKQVPLTDLERRPENVRSTANLFGLPMFCHYGIGGPGFGAWRSSSASIALFLEYIPQNVFEWLGEQVSAGEESTDRALALVDRDVEAGIAFMNAHGLLHFDMHFQNMLTDGRRLYFADYGLAISSRFELAEEELSFFARHQNYDRRYAAMYASQWLVTALLGCAQDERESRLRAYAAGEAPAGLPQAASAVLARDAPIAVLMTDFFRALQRESRQRPYPAERG